MVAVTFSLVDISNEALGQTGKAFITSLDDPDQASRLCKQYIPSLLTTMLRDHKWNFAEEHAELAQEAATPLIKFTYQYALPPDCMKVWTLNESDTVAWIVKGRKLLTDESTAKIDYTRYVDDPNEWDGSFRQAVVTYLASRLAGPLTGDMRKMKDLYDLYIVQLSDAKATDGQEGSTETYESTALTDDIRDA